MAVRKIKREVVCVRSTTEHGFTVLLATLLAAIVLAIGLSVLDITTKQVRLAGIARESEEAFQAANAGMECVRFQDLRNASFAIPQGSAMSIDCFGQSATNSKGAAGSTDEQLFEWTWGDSNNLCTQVSVYKYFSSSGGEPMDSSGLTGRTCPEGAECTVIKARGYNAACSQLDGPDVVERELTVIY